LPESRDQDSIDHDVRVVEWIEGEARPAKAAHHALDAESRVQDPLPGKSGDDEGQREWIEEDGAEGVLEPDLLVQKGRQQKADDQREGER
jgi:hypothetical protein